MSIFTAELIGTALLILLGNGVVSSCVLKQTHAVGVGVGWIVITTAWGFAVFVGVTVAGPVSGAHLNPAVTLGLAALGKTPWDQVPTYFAGQFLGAMLGAFCVWLYFRDQFAATEDEGAKKACFCTGPAIRNLPNNFFCEMLATFVLLFVIYYIIGYAINPARDLGPRLVLTLLPMKVDTDWSYAWVPGVAPMVGALLASGLYMMLQ